MCTDILRIGAQPTTLYLKLTLDL